MKRLIVIMDSCTDFAVELLKNHCQQPIIFDIVPDLNNQLSLPTIKLTTKNMCITTDDVYVHLSLSVMMGMVPGLLLVTFIENRSLDPSQPNSGAI